MFFVKVIILSILIMLAGALTPLGTHYLLPTVFNNIAGFTLILCASTGLILYGMVLCTSTFQILFKKLGWIQDG